VALLTYVVGVDDTAQSVEAARTACRLAACVGAEVHAVHVAHVPATMLSVLAGVPSAATDFVEAQRAAVWGNVGPLLDDADVPVRRVDLEGYPSDTLVSYAAEVDAAMIVVGSRGRGDLASLVLGSTSHRVVNHAHCDVLIAKGESEETR
jgi:nucleotide-binding universal stress UspA family protein